MSRQRPTVKEFLNVGHPNDREVIEREFFSRVFLPNGTVKTTCAHRLDDVNQAFLPGLLCRKQQEPLRVMDVGISSGVSTLEWSDFLNRQGIACEITATDLVLDAYHSSGPMFALLRDKSGKLLHFDALGRGFPPGQRWSYLHAILQAMTIGAISLASWFGSTKRNRVRLLTAKFTNKINAVEDDLTAPNSPAFVGAFDVIRTANLVNLGYFPEDVLLKMLANLKQRLKPGGLLIICRTWLNGTNHGTLFSLTGTRLVPIDRIGTGSEVEKLAAGL